MNKTSERLDFVDKALDLRNLYIDSQKQRIIKEIMWLEENYANPQKLREYFVKPLYMQMVLHLEDEKLQQLAEIRGNYLYAQLRGLDQKKVETTPLKIIVHELKQRGQ